MKKLMIVAVAAVAAIVTNASTVNWGASNVAKTDNQTDATKYVGVLVDASAYSTAADAAKAIWGGSTSGIIDTKAGVEASGKAKFQGTQIPMASTYDDVTTMSFYTILFDGSVGTGATAKNYIANDAKKNVTKTEAGLFNATIGNQSGASWTAVPEPTSGLLLLLGVAGLALRRRHA